MNVNPDNEPATKGELKRVHRSLALEIVKTNARIDKLGDGLRGEMRGLHSDLVKKIDGFMSKVGKIDRAQVIADWRVAELERRVARVEPPLS